MARIFLSYAREDVDFAKQLAEGVGRALRDRLLLEFLREIREDLCGRHWILSEHQTCRALQALSDESAFVDRA